MSLPRRQVEAIARAVEKAGGDMDDVRDLIAVWERVQVDSYRRAGGIRATVRARGCTCGDGGAANGGERCGRCYGRRHG